MLDPGSYISFKDEASGKEVLAFVHSCNRRGTQCKVELRPGEVRVLDLNKVQYEVLEEDEENRGASGSQEEFASGGGSDDDMGAKEEAEKEENGIGEEVSEGGTGEDEELQGEDEELPALDALDPKTRGPVDHLCTAAAGPEAFAQPSEDLADAAKQGLKAIFAFALVAAPEWAPMGSLRELYVDGFDAEQIWGQLEAAAGPVLKQLRKRVKPLDESITLLDEETEAALDELMDGAPESEEEEDDLEEDEDMGGEEDLEEPAERQPKKRKTGKRALERGQADGVAAGEQLPTEDDFLRLDDMERFVQDAEEAAMRDNASEEEPEGDEEEDDDDDDLGGGLMEGLNEDALGGAEADAMAEESNSDEEDAQLARLLESASEAAGKRGGKRAREEDSGDEEAAFYDDFFGSGPRPVSGRQGTGSDEEEEDAAFEGVEDLSDFEVDGDEVDEEDMEDGEDGEDMEDEDDLDGHREQLLGTLQRMLDDKRAEEDADAAEGMGSGGKLSAHEQRVARMAQRARRLEEENMGEKDWFMRGETKAGARPLNSALEVDLDFDRALKPPPQPTEEFTSSLEDLIKRRIAERNFDDPARREPPPDDLNKELAELDDKRSSKGLGEVYEEEYVRAKTGNAAEDKDEATRAQARLLLKGLFAKLDALSHFHFAPKPIIKEMAVQSEVPALAMEEVAPQVVSEAARQLPEEVYKAPKAGAAKTDEVVGKAERKRSRAAHKRAFKKRTEQEANGEQAPKGKSNIVGRKSAEEDSAAAATEKKARKKSKRKRGREEEGPTAPKIKYTKSAAVFGKIQDAINSKGAAKAAGPSTKSSKNLKL